MIVCPVDALIRIYETSFVDKSIDSRIAKIIVSPCEWFHPHAPIQVLCMVEGEWLNRNLLFEIPLISLTCWIKPFIPVPWHMRNNEDHIWLGVEDFRNEGVQSACSQIWTL